MTGQIQELTEKVEQLKALLQRCMPVSYTEDEHGNKYPVLYPDASLFDEIEEAIK